MRQPTGQDPTPAAPLRVRTSIVLMSFLVVIVEPGRARAPSHRYNDNESPASLATVNRSDCDALDDP